MIQKQYMIIPNEINRYFFPFYQYPFNPHYFSIWKFFYECLLLKKRKLFSILIAEYIFMKNQITRSHSLGDIIIKFQPKSITFNKPKEAKYKLYLEKNVQIISQTIEIIKVTPKNPHYAFVSQTSISPFRVASQKLSTYQLTIYQTKSTGEETFVDKAEFSLQKFLRTYYQELQDIEQQLKTKQRSAIIDAWKGLSNNFTRKTYNTACKFKEIDAILEFICAPQTEYDRLAKSELVKKEKVQIFSLKSNKYQLTKSKTLPQLVHQNRFDNKKYHQNDSDILEIKQNPNIDEKEKKEMTESLKQFKIKIPQVSKNGKFQGKQQAKVQSCYQIAQQNEEDIRLQKQQQDFMLKQQQKQGLPYSLPTKRSLNEFSVPQTQSIETRIANLSLNSAIYLEKQSERKSQTSKKIKQVMLTCTLVGAYLFSIVFLMHPISKV